MNLSDLGYNDELAAWVENNPLSDLSIGRVTQEHRERYVVSDGENEFEAEITGNLRFSSNSRTDFPAVGDWVAMKTYNSDQAIIHRILPRKSVLERQAIAKPGETQIISANIDVAFIVQAISNNFSINRLERYLTICYAAGIEPVMVISKTDLSGEEQLNNVVSDIEKREKKTRCIMLSNVTHKGLDQVMDLIHKGKTYCVIGPSGAGKSTLINNLLKKNVLKTSPLSLSTNKGKHTTEHRELFVLENGGIVIDTPGMKEIGMTDNKEGITTTFHEIVDIGRNCRFPDCRHINEKGCAVLEALNNGTIDKDSYLNYQKILKEQERFQTTVAEKRKKDKVFGKMIKRYNKDRERNDQDTV